MEDKSIVDTHWQYGHGQELSQEEREKLWALEKPDDIDLEKRKKIIEKQLHDIIMNPEKYKSKAEHRRAQQRNNKDYLRKKRARKLADTSKARNR